MFSIWSEPLHSPLLNDIHLGSDLRRSTGLKWGCAYHGNVTEDGEQYEVEGAHGSVVSMSNRQKLNANSDD